MINLTDQVPENIAKPAKIAELITIAGMILPVILVSALATWWLFGIDEFDKLIVDEILPDGISVSVTPGIRWVTLIACAIPALFVLYGLDLVRRLFRGYRRGEIFSPRAARRLEHIGWIVVALSPVYKLTETLAILLITTLGTPDDKYFSISFDSGDIFAIVFGLLVVVVGRIMQHASRINEENRSFI